MRSDRELAGLLRDSLHQLVQEMPFVHDRLLLGSYGDGPIVTYGRRW